MTSKEIADKLVEIYNLDLDTLREVREELKERCRVMTDREETTYNGRCLRMIENDIFDTIELLQYHQ